MLCAERRGVVVVFCVFSERFCFAFCLWSLFCPADWAMRWIGSDATFAERLVAFAAVEVRSRVNSFSAHACAA